MGKKKKKEGGGGGGGGGGGVPEVNRIIAGCDGWFGMRDFRVAGICRWWKGSW